MVSDILAQVSRKRHDDLVLENPAKVIGGVNAKSGGGKQERDTYNIGGSWHEKVSVDPTLKALDSGKDYEAVGIPFNNKWAAHRRVNGKYQMMAVGEDGNPTGNWQDVPNANQIALNLSIQHLLTSSGGVNLPGTGGPKGKSAEEIKMEKIMGGFKGTKNEKQSFFNEYLEKQLKN